MPKNSEPTLSQMSWIRGQTLLVLLSEKKTLAHKGKEHV